jgi:hypothetical protein
MTPMTLMRKIKQFTGNGVNKVNFFRLSNICKTWGEIRDQITRHQNGKSDADSTTLIT